MAAKIVYVCSACGARAPKWAGQCGDCLAWNTLEESRVAPAPRAGGRSVGYAGETAAGVRCLSEVSAEPIQRQPSGMDELDRVLGGGLVRGSVVLIGGDPGIGKSTLLIQMLARLAEDNKSLYVTGEESAEQISLRARRLELKLDSLRVLTETSVEHVLQQARTEQPRIMVVDSIQTLYSEALQSAPGAVAQIRESAAQLVCFAKRSGTSIFLVGHVTKEGSLAGPRVLEHMVDTVLYFEGDRGNQFRLIRAIKNRFGAVNELGIFAMTDKGLRTVGNPSAIFLSGHQQEAPGSVILVTREGSRPLLVEVQALVDDSPLGNPRRVSLGLEQNRLAMLLAVLHRHGGIPMYDQDVYVNVVGGVRITETASDLATIAAILSSYRDRPLSPKLVVFGELGLAGEIRPVQNGQERLREAAKHGFTRAIVPTRNAPRKGIGGLKIFPVARLADAVEAFFHEG